MNETACPLSDEQIDAIAERQIDWVNDGTSEVSLRRFGRAVATACPECLAAFRPLVGGQHRGKEPAVSTLQEHIDLLRKLKALDRSATFSMAQQQYQSAAYLMIDAHLEEIASLRSAQQRAEAAEALVAGLRTALADSCADERHQKWEATSSGGGCSRAIDAEAERDAAYERAAKACENMATYCDDPDECAAAIRSLKTQEPA